MSIVACVSGIAKVTASSRIQPKTTETKTDVHMPVAAILDALRVSSAVCADASNPVIVYWDIRSPSPKTNQNAGLENEVVPSPVARVVHRLREDVRERLMLIGNDDEDADDEHDADHVPPGGDHVQPRRAAGC